MSSEVIVQWLQNAIRERTDFFDSKHETAFRLFNGFTEGYPEFVLEIYARTLVLHNYANDATSNAKLIQDLVDNLKSSISWLRAVVVKNRIGKTQADRKGILIFGKEPDAKISEHGVWYSVDLTLNRDTSFYLDTRYLRKWLIENMQGQAVLNTFAYTGSLGVAALAGGAAHVLQHDLNRKFLSLAKESYILNGFPVHTQDFVAADFFPTIARLKNTKQTFDCVILDPPFFSTTSKGKVDQEKDSTRLINKVRPLINDGGYLVAINNALYVRGSEYLQTLEDLCRDGYLKIEQLIPIPQDCTGFKLVGKPIADPNPFNHSTKIVVLKVRRKHS